MSYIFIHLKRRYSAKYQIYFDNLQTFYLHNNNENIFSLKLIIDFRKLKCHIT